MLGLVLFAVFSCYFMSVWGVHIIIKKDSAMLNTPVKVLIPNIAVVMLLYIMAPFTLIALLLARVITKTPRVFEENGKHSSSI